MASWLFFILVFTCTKFAANYLNKYRPEKPVTLNGLFQRVWPVVAALYYIGYWGVIKSLKVGIVLGLFIGNWAIFAVIGFIISFIIKKLFQKSDA